MVGWAQSYASNDWLGVPAGLLNDDRLGRALDALSRHLDEVAGALAMAAIARFGADAARLHWDFTSVAFCGSYAEQDPSAPHIGFGHSSDHQGHRRQLKVAHATTASGIALYGRVTDGSRHQGAETSTLLEQLRSLASPRRLLLVADSALVTKDNLAAVDAAKIHFVSRLPRSFDSYCSQRQARLPNAQRHTFRGAEAAIEVTGDDKVTRAFRVLYVRGSEEAGASAASRARILARAEAALEGVARGLAARPRQDPEKVSRRVAKAVAAGQAGSWLRTELGTGADGKLTLVWARDEEAIADAERRDGLYALITNMTTKQCSADRLLTLYKEQFLSERAHHFLKGPLAVRPVFLKNNNRAAALVQVCSFALLVYGLIEADVRAAIAPAKTMKSLLPEGRAARPTAANIFAAFAGVGYQRARTTNGLAYIPDPITSAQGAILKALGIASILPPDAEKSVPGCGKRA